MLQSGKRKNQRRGTALLWVTVAMMVMIAFVGLALDTGYAVLVGQQLQHAADASALAGAQIVRSGPSRVTNAAVSIANLNTAAGSPLQVQNSDVSIGTFASGSFSKGGLSPNAVKVTPRRVAGAPGSSVPTFFGAIFGVATMDMTRTATAAVSGSGSPAMVVLDPTDGCSLDVRGTGSLYVLGGPIQVNSTNATAACVAGNAGISAESLDVTGGTLFNGGAVIDALVNKNVPAIPDPLASLPAPTPGTPLGSINVGPGLTQTIDPGYYNGGITVRGTLILNPGIYIIAGTGLAVNSQGAIRSLGGVMLYITGGSSFDASANNVNIQLSAPDPTRDTFAGVDTYAGVTIFQDRTDIQEAKLSLAGSIQVNGTLYFPSAQLSITAGGSEAGARIIAGEVKISGSANVVINNRSGRPTDGRPYIVQ